MDDQAFDPDVDLREAVGRGDHPIKLPWWTMLLPLLRVVAVALGLAHGAACGRRR